MTAEAYFYLQRSEASESVYLKDPRDCFVVISRSKKVSVYPITEDTSVQDMVAMLNENKSVYVKENFRIPDERIEKAKMDLRSLLKQLQRNKLIKGDRQLIRFRVHHASALHQTRRCRPRGSR